jgi:hypothetical protein
MVGVASREPAPEIGVGDAVAGNLAEFGLGKRRASRFLPLNPFLQMIIICLRSSPRERRVRTSL